MALILGLSGRSDFPSRTNPATGEVISTTYTLAKTAHVVEYGVLGSLLLRAATASGGGLALAPTRAAIWVVGAATAFGIGDELRQSLVPTREPRVSDVAIDALSASAAVALMLLWRRLRGPQRVAQRILE
jgi:VanZ family protein